MALKEAALKKIAGLLKLDETKFLTAVKAADEQDIEIADDLQVMSKADADIRDRNKYNEGKTVGMETTLKEIKTKHNIAVEGVDPDKIVEAIAKKAVDDAKIAPDEQVKEAKKLTDQWKTKATDAENKALELEKQKNQLTNDNQVRMWLPRDRSDILQDDEYLGSVRARFDFQEKDGKRIVVDRTTGETVRDKTKLEPVAPEEVVKNYFTERKWMTDPKAGGGAGGAGGRGGGNSNPGGAKGKYAKISELKKELEDKGVNLQGKEGTAMLRAAIKENPEMDLNS